MNRHYDNKVKNLYEINLKKLRENYEYGEFAMLDYLKDFITPDLKKLYIEVMEYNEIYANGWTIQELFKMGETDSYWKERAEKFIEKYNIPKKDYDEYTKYFDQYCEIRNELLDELGLLQYIVSDIPVSKIPEHGFLETDNITKVKDIKQNNSYTIARVRDFGHCIELHYYPNGIAEIECGYKRSHDCWENEIEDANWFDKNMTDEEVINKLCELFDEHFNITHNKSDVTSEDVSRFNKEDDYGTTL